MAGVIGNSGGKKGRSGRKSKYQELADAERLRQTYYEPIDQEELEQKIRSGKFSIEDRVKLTAMEGDTVLLNRFVTKVYRDNVDVTTAGAPIPLLNVIQHNNGGTQDTETKKAS